MSLKLRLVLSYIAMLVVPIILSVIAAFIILFLQLGGIARQHEIRPNYFKDLTTRASTAYMELEAAVDQNPDKLGDTAYLSDMDSRLNLLNTGLAVKKGGSWIYRSKFLDARVIDQLISNESRVRYMSHPIMVDNEPYSVMTRYFRFSDKSEGTLYYIAGIGPVSRFARGYLSTLGIVVLIIAVFVNGLLTFLVYRSIVRPLRILKHGTEQIRDGNLNFNMECGSKDEIGEVCSAFEEMRAKLKGSIDSQLKMEENRKELVSNISHDLKTPVTSIKGYVEGILDGVADSPEKMDRYVQTIYRKACDMDRLIDDLFLFSKLDVKKLPFNFEKVDIDKYFRDCRDELQMDLEKSGTTLEYESGLDSVLVVADREKLKRVVMNIVENSVKYKNRDDGRILIRLSEEAEKVRVEISDNGQGIEASELTSIFERFYRADSTRSASTGGSGLGLAIARQLVEGHGGEIWAESTLNKGTSIFFTLRKLPADEKEAPEKP